MATREDFLVCIRCGLCLEACPTYRQTFDEGFSARGRIALLEALTLGVLAADEPAARSLSHCLLCCSCQAVCPSGVRYERLLSRARGELDGARATGREARWQRRIRGLLQRPRLLSLALRTVRWAARGGMAAAGVRLLFPREHHAHYLDLVAAVRASSRVPRRRKGRAEAAPRALIFSGCVTPVVFPQVLTALESVLEKAGVTHAAPRKQVCCGALHLHSGDLDGARRLARRNIAAFESAGEPVILAEAAGCAAALKEYGELLAGDPDYAERARAFAARVRDATEYLGELRASATAGAPSAGARPIVYQDACHQRHLQGLAPAARRLLDGFPQLARADAIEEDLCCGSAGVFNLLHPSMAAALGERKAEALAATGAEIVVTANPGCRLQLEGRLARRGIAMRHAVEMCDELWPGS